MLASSFKSSQVLPVGLQDAPIQHNPGLSLGPGTSTCFRDLGKSLFANGFASAST